MVTLPLNSQMLALRLLVEHNDVAIIEIKGKSHRVEGWSKFINLVKGGATAVTDKTVESI
jgi:hypothetical protein